MIGHPHRAFPLLACCVAALSAGFLTSATDEASGAEPTFTVLDDEALLFPAWTGSAAGGSLFGRAVNGVAHQTSPIVTHGDYQYAAWYRLGASDEDIMLGRRDLTNPSSVWESFDTGLNLNRGDGFDEERSPSTPTQTQRWDSHNAINVGVSGDGRIHLAYDHHSNVLRYIHGDALASSWGRQGVFGTDQISGVQALEQDSLIDSDPELVGVTYPRFATNPVNGDLVATYRLGQSGAGDLNIANYDAATGQWSAGREFISGNDGAAFNDFVVTGITSTSTSRNPYLNGIDYGQDGSLHASFTWRETANGTANHNINYISSVDGGQTWRNDSGDTVAGVGQTVSITSPGIIIDSDTSYVSPFVIGSPNTLGDDPLGLIDRNQTLINQQSQVVDDDGGMHVLMWSREDPSTHDSGDFTFDTQEAAYFHYYRDPQTEAWSKNQIPLFDAEGFDVQVGSRPQIAYDNQGDVYAAYISPGVALDSSRNILDNGFLVIAAATAENNYEDWAILYEDRDAVYEGEPLVDQDRLLRDGVLSVFIQETSSVSTLTTSDLLLVEFEVDDFEHPARDNLLLDVDPDTGRVRLVNGFDRVVSIDAYAIRSESGSLDPSDEGWSSLADSLALGSGWDESNPSSQLLAELAASGVSELQPGQSIELGLAFTVGGQDDLSLEFLNDGDAASVDGMVRYVELGLPGDFNDDGSVDAADYTVWRDAVGTSAVLANDLTPGVVDASDYELWRTFFGRTVQQASSVPEPSTLVLALAPFVGIVRRSRRG